MSNPEDDLIEPHMLRLLDLLYRTRSVTQAAAALGQSQSTVSIWLGKLRRRLNDPLFVRTPTGMQPTPRVEALIEPVRNALDALRLLTTHDATFDPATADRTFRICMTDASHITLLPRLLAHVRALAPAVRLVAARIDGETAAALQNGEADLALGLVPWLDAGFYQQALFPQDWVCLLNSRHPRISQKLTMQSYRNEGHIGIVGGTGAALLENAMERQQVHRRIMLELPGFLGLAAIASSTDLIATVPRHIGETLATMATLSILPCPVDIPSFTVKQHWHARYHHDPANRWLRGICETLFQSHQIARGEPKAGMAAQRASRAQRR
ncbi:LysR family transcriptional regulator [Cupriavidus sp. CV2]|uniref:LysR family transcriptional regulator n=1 Tax=Cupriavidus ulmosensis TaxID=3065913 RepID=UPI00296AFAE8|nr:LysR family transcriptional regulator [Cupriavidus sp. CV2]MDW3688248.1 LysR family transcriptional regulator [Cupriavidus sp. CV2]